MSIRLKEAFQLSYVKLQNTASDRSIAPDLNIHKLGQNRATDSLRTLLCKVYHTNKSMATPLVFPTGTKM